MKQAIKRFLVKKELYYPLRYSWSFRLYESLFKPSAARRQKKEEAFYRSFLSPCQLIFDVGAYDGHKTEAFLKLAGKVVCCEPDDHNYHLLQARFRNKTNKIALEKKAVSDKAGFTEYHVHHPGSAFNTLSPKWTHLLESQGKEKWNEEIKFTAVKSVETTTLDLLIREYGLPGFIKIDVEGSEESVLKGLSQPVNYLSFETLLPDYRKELQNCLTIVESLSPSAGYNIAADEKLVLPAFVSKDALEDYINTNTISASFEVIVKMPA